MMNTHGDNPFGLVYLDTIPRPPAGDRRYMSYATPLSVLQDGARRAMDTAAQQVDETKFLPQHAGPDNHLGIKLNQPKYADAVVFDGYGRQVVYAPHRYTHPSAFMMQ